MNINIIDKMFTFSPQSLEPAPSKYESLDSNGWHSFNTFDEQHAYKLTQAKKHYYSKSYIERLLIWIKDIIFLSSLWYSSFFEKNNTSSKIIDPRQSDFYSLYTPGWIPGTVNWRE